MKFYKQQHEFYCGIDLHANSMHVCVVDHVGNKLLHKNFDTKKPERFLTAIRSYSKNDLIIGCESTFNWYWLADLCHDQQLPFLLGHALYLKAIHGGKTKTDRIDPKSWRCCCEAETFQRAMFIRLQCETLAICCDDVVQLFVVDLATITHVQIVNHQQNLPAFEKSISYRTIVLAWRIVSRKEIFAR